MKNNLKEVLDKGSNFVLQASDDGSIFIVINNKNGLKKPCLSIVNGRTITKVASFNSFESAQLLVDTLNSIKSLNDFYDDYVDFIVKTYGE